MTNDEKIKDLESKITDLQSLFARSVTQIESLSSAIDKIATILEHHQKHIDETKNNPQLLL